jgi:hypothetical protein
MSAEVYNLHLHTDKQVCMRACVRACVRPVPLTCGQQSSLFTTLTSHACLTCSSGVGRWQTTCHWHAAAQEA